MTAIGDKIDISTISLDWQNYNNTGYAIYTEYSTNKLLVGKVVTLGVLGVFNTVDEAIKYCNDNSIIPIPPVPPIPPVTGIRVDSDGVQQFYASDPNGQSVILLKSSNPNSTPGFGLNAGGAATPVIVSPAFTAWKIPSKTQNLASGGTDQTIRLDMVPLLSKGNPVVWQTAITQGYQVVPKDIRISEMTAYIQIPASELISDDDITFKQGGLHTSTNPAWAGSLGINVNFSGTTTKTCEIELNHPSYDFPTNKKIFTYTSIIGKWVGVKQITREINGNIVIDVYLDIDGIYISTGKPKNNWKHYFNWVINGLNQGQYTGIIPKFGRRTFTIRVDKTKSMNFAMCSIRAIDPLTGLGIPA